MASQKLSSVDGEYLDRQPESAARERLIRPTRIQVQRELEVLARVMDDQFVIPVLNWRFGMNAVIDLIPGIGDVATTVVAIYILISAVRYRVPKITLLRMGVNIAIYFLGGLLPWVGDLFDAWWKPNRRNLRLLHLRATVSPDEAHKGRRSDWVFVGVIVAVLLALLCGALAVAALVIWAVVRALR